MGEELKSIWHSNRHRVENGIYGCFDYLGAVLKFLQRQGVVLKRLAVPGWQELELVASADTLSCKAYEIC